MGRPATEHESTGALGLRFEGCITPPSPGPDPSLHEATTRVREARTVNVTGEAGPDWLDDHCWACGSEDVESRAGDRVLCSPCRSELFDPPPADDSMGVIHQLYWQ